MYHSVVIEECLAKPEILKNYKIVKTKFGVAENWHLHIIEISGSLDVAILKIQGIMVSDKPYYFHIYDQGETLIVVFKDKVFHLDPGDESTWQEARRYGGEKLGIPGEQLDFCPTKISDEDAWYSR